MDQMGLGGGGPMGLSCMKKRTGETIEVIKVSSSPRIIPTPGCSQGMVFAGGPEGVGGGDPAGVSWVEAWGVDSDGGAVWFISYRLVN